MLTHGNAIKVLLALLLVVFFNFWPFLSILPIFDKIWYFWRFLPIWLPFLFFQLLKTLKDFISIVSTLAKLVAFFIKTFNEGSFIYHHVMFPVASTVCKKVPAASQTFPIRDWVCIGIGV